MDGERLFEMWAPSNLGSMDGNPPWTNWAKPVLFASYVPPVRLDEPLQPVVVQAMDNFPAASRDTAVVVDLPGAESVVTGVELARKGYRPVPLFNASPAPTGVFSIAVKVREIVEELQSGGPAIAEMALPVDAPPAFLIDSERLSGSQEMKPGTFDNRWIVLPQDFPSANLLLARGIKKVVVIQALAGQPKTDLCHVLLRWQKAGIQILVKSSLQDSPALMTVERPSRFMSIWHVALALIGLRRNSAGGFGGIIPVPSSGGGYHGGFG